MVAEIRDVFVIPDGRSGELKEAWIKIGVAFVNKDNSLNVILDAIPVNGKLHIRDRVSPKKKEGEKS